MLFLLITSWLTVRSAMGAACTNDAIYEDETDFLYSGTTYELPRNYTLPENVTTNPLTFNEDELMLQGRIVFGEAATDKTFTYQVAVLGVCIEVCRKFNF